MKARYGITLLRPEQLSSKEWLEAFAYEIDTMFQYPADVGLTFRVRRLLN